MNLQSTLQWLKSNSKVSLSVDLGSARELNSNVEFLFKYPASCRRHLGHELFNFSVPNSVYLSIVYCS